MSNNYFIEAKFSVSSNIIFRYIHDNNKIIICVFKIILNRYEFIKIIKVVKINCLQNFQNINFNLLKLNLPTYMKKLVS